MSGARLAEAAEALVGAPFRLHGRDPASGLDCVGVIAAALAACGRAVPAPHGYGLRNRSIAPWLMLAERAGLAETAAPLAPGDAVLARPGPGQHHLLIALAGGRFVHAHAGLRRVVVQPGPLPWPELRRWRLAPQD
ncbi:MAG: NlpC/P60 family protein [Cypionkella sp.]